MERKMRKVGADLISNMLWGTERGILPGIEVCN